MKNRELTVDTKRVINGKEFGTQQGIHPNMFHGTGLFLYKLVSGRGRAKEEVIVKYDSSYPAHRIAKDLQALRLCFDSLEDYHSYLNEFLGHWLPNSNSATDRVEAIQNSVDRFKSVSTGTRNWTKADELLSELSDILNGSITNE